jgi:hypothetical protein
VLVFDPPTVKKPRDAGAGDVVPVMQYTLLSPHTRGAGFVAPPLQKYPALHGPVHSAEVSEDEFP